METPSIRISELNSCPPLIEPEKESPTSRQAGEDEALQLPSAVVHGDWQRLEFLGRDRGPYLCRRCRQQGSLLADGDGLGRASHLKVEVNCDHLGHGHV